MTDMTFYQAKHLMITLETRTEPNLIFSFELDTSAELSKQDQVQDDGSRQQRILTRVV